MSILRKIANFKDPILDRQIVDMVNAINALAAGDIGAEVAGVAADLDAQHLIDFTHEDITHANRAALDDVEGVNTGDQDLSAYDTHLAATEAHGATGAVVGTTNAQTLTNKKFGGASDYTEFEADGTMVAKGAATTYDDIQFAISSGRTAAANAPTWEAFTANTSEYSFAVNDYIDQGANEMAHWWREGTVVQAHLHLTLKTANSSGADRYAKFTVYVAYAKVDSTWAETAVTAELVIPTGTAAMTHAKLTLGNIDLTGMTINTQVKVRTKRIAATGGTEYAANMFVTQFGLHAEKDTQGSRQITTK